MLKYIALEPHRSSEELHQRYRTAYDPVECSRWHMLWLLSQRQTARAVAASTGYSPYWVGKRLLSDEQLEALRQAIAGPPPEGGRVDRTDGGGVGESPAGPSRAVLSRLGVPRPA